MRRNGEHNPDSLANAPSLHLETVMSVIVLCGVRIFLTLIPTHSKHPKHSLRHYQATRRHLYCTCASGIERAAFG